MLSQPIYSIDELKAVFRVLLSDPNNSETLCLMAFLRRTLRQHNLDSYYEEREILSETYVRGVKQIESGEPIKIALPWIKGTCLNVIREKSRVRKKFIDYASVEPKIAGIALNEDITEDDVNKDLIQVLQTAFQKLKPKEQELLNLKIVKDLPWKEIHGHLATKGKKVPSELALRKQKQRALDNLRKLMTDPPAT